MRLNRKDIGLHIVKRKCYHCGYEMELAVLNGIKLAPPSPDEPCCKRGFTKQFHDLYGMFIQIEGKPKKEFGWEDWDGKSD